MSHAGLRSRSRTPLVTHTRDLSRHSGPLPWISWQYSLILPVALVLVAVSLLLTEPRKDLLEIRVESSTSGEVIPGAMVQIGSLNYRADDHGRVVLERPDNGSSISAFYDGFAPVEVSFATDSQRYQTIQMKPSIVSGTLLDAATGDPIPGATVSLRDSAGVDVASTRTDGNGAYIFKNLPEQAMLHVSAGAFGTHDEPVGDRHRIDLQLDRSVVSGTVLDDVGEPIQGAVVRSGSIRAVTGTDGVFMLEGISQGADITITASGYEAMVRTIDAERLDDVVLEPQVIKAVYASWGLLSDPDGLDSLIEIANTTEINAIVIDIKQDTIYYDSQVQFFRDAETVAPIYDARELISKLEANNIYPIARLVVFQDPLVAEAYPHLAVHDTSGGLWRNEMGVAWVNSFHEELWDANIELAVEAVGLGFKEIQYDYVRFPSDGDLSTADFGREYTGVAREAAITEFMKRSHAAIHDAGGMLAADLFGFITIVDDEQYIGQRFSQLEPYIDYVCMMIYPSHFTEGNIASAPGHPNDYPYETIYESLQRAELITPGAARKFRPWLQDFSYWKMREYGPADVRAQIDAAEEFGASGWMLWGDPFNVTVEALRPDTEGE